MAASAQLSVYPLRQPHLGPAVEAVRDTLIAHGLAPQVGPMSTLVSGEVDVLFGALGAAFAAAAEAAEAGEVVMTFTVSNAYPVPGAAA